MAPILPGQMTSSKGCRWSGSASAHRPVSFGHRGVSLSPISAVESFKTHTSTMPHLENSRLDQIRGFRAASGKRRRRVVRGVASFAVFRRSCARWLLSLSKHAQGLRNIAMFERGADDPPPCAGRLMNVPGGTTQLAASAHRAHLMATGPVYKLGPGTGPGPRPENGAGGASGRPAPRPPGRPVPGTACGSGAGRRATRSGSPGRPRRCAPTRRGTR